MRLPVPFLVFVAAVSAGCGIYGCGAHGCGAPRWLGSSAEPVARAAEPVARAAEPAHPGSVEARRAAVTGEPTRAAHEEAGGETGAGEPGIAAVRRAVSRALPFLEQEGVAWMEGRVPVQEGQGCVSCHHVPYAVWSHAEARRAGIHPGAGMAELETRAVEFTSRRSKARALNVAPLLLGQAHGEMLVQRLLEHQEPAGHFRARGQFPAQRRPVAEGNAVATTLSLLALNARPGEGSAVAAAGRASEWLDEAPDSWRSTEWIAVRLLLASADLEENGPRPGAISPRHQLEVLQNPDGGWPWAEGEPSNAFSTGQALHALAAAHATRGARSAEIIEAGQRYLVGSQRDDGTWTVASSLVSEEGTADRDVIYHYWGTAWATIGLARSLDSAEVSRTER